MTQSAKIDADDTDQEITAMTAVSKAIAPLSAEVQKRVLDWAYARFLSIAPSASPGHETSKPGGSGPLEMTTDMIVLKLGGGDNCQSLMEAAACQLVLVKGKQRFSRQDLLTEMKDSSYFKESYTGNMSYYIKNLLKAGFFNEPQKNVYAIVPHHLKQLEKKLA